MDVLESLNNEQLAAVKETEGYVRVVAGPGTGKTRTLTHRYAYIVQELGVSPSNILCVTFTNKAANEMKKRINAMIGDYDCGYICTFHSMALKMLKDDTHKIGYPPNFKVMDGSDADLIFKAIYKDIGITSRDIKYNTMKDFIKEEKCFNFSHIQYFENNNDDRLIDKDIAKAWKKKDKKKYIYLRYIKEELKNYYFDFDDLITIELHLLNNYEDVRKKWQERLNYIMVDEFQDVSLLNYNFVEILSSLHKNLFIVGDPDQTIYSWRGARVEFFLEFDKVHSNAKTIYLKNNYRSTNQILNCSNELIFHNEYRLNNKLVSINGDGSVPIFGRLANDYDEADWVVKKILSLKKEIKYSNIAILYRAHYISRPIEEKLLRNKIPYTVLSGIEFYGRKEIKDALSYLKLIIDSKDNISFRRVINSPHRGFGDKTIDKIVFYANQKKLSLYESLKEIPEISKKAETINFIKNIEKYKQKYSTYSKNDKVSTILNGILKDTGYEKMLKNESDTDRLDNIAELKQSIIDYEKSNDGSNVEDYLNDIALYTNSDKEKEKESVKLMTIHAAKGLEFDCVFLCGVVEGKLPSSRSTTKDELEEERRLAYVAYTRAKRYLFMSGNDGYNFVTEQNGEPSRFIYETGKNVEWDDYDKRETENNFKEKNYKKTKKLKLHKGDLVEHELIGRGVVVEVDQIKHLYIIKFDKYKTNRSISNNFNKIKKID